MTRVEREQPEQEPEHMRLNRARGTQRVEQGAERMGWKLGLLGWSGG